MATNNDDPQPNRRADRVANIFRNLLQPDQVQLHIEESDNSDTDDKVQILAQLVQSHKILCQSLMFMLQTELTDLEED